MTPSTRTRLELRFTAPQWLTAGELMELAAEDGGLAYARITALTAGIATAVPARQLPPAPRRGGEHPRQRRATWPRRPRRGRSRSTARAPPTSASATSAAPRSPSPAAGSAGTTATATCCSSPHRSTPTRCPAAPGSGCSPNSRPARCSPPALRFGLRVAGSEASFGLDPTGPAAWALNVADDLFYADPEALAIDRPPLSVDETSSAPVAWLPLGLEDAWSTPAGPLPVVRTPLERDGLSRFDSRIFLDPLLAELGPSALADEAIRLRDVEGRALFGLHGAFHISATGRDTDATLIAVPDAAQPGWSRRHAGPLPEQPAPVVVPPANWIGHRGFCPSEAETVAAPDWSRFLDCDTRALPTPVLTAFDEAQPIGTLTLTWTASTSGAIYTLEEATEADLSDAEAIWTGTDLTATVPVPREGVYRYRLTARDGEDVSAPSAIAAAVVDRAWALKTPTAYDAPELAILETLHRATLRTAAASGELFAMLSLPRHFRTTAATLHAERLVRQAGYDPAEVRTLSFGALYHPWLVTPSGDVDAPALLEFPPDGAAAGIAAARSLARGAWIAPANEIIRDIVALADPLDDSDRQQLGEAGLNLVRHDARGFLVLDAQTLSTEPEWRQINVRRLMSLLRRTALDRGRRYVFEPNGDVLRRAVERGFTQMLDELFRRGAFAGKGRDDSYRLTVNPTSQDRDAGRLIVEIAVAPSQPMRFLTVRLVQSGERFSVAETR